MGNFRSGNSRGGFGGNRSSGRDRRDSDSRGGGFNRSRGGFGGGREGSRDRDSGGFERRKPEMHEATCAKCGKQCEVPFKPTGDKPVLCRDCFRQEGSNPSPRGNFNSVNRPTASPAVSSSGISQEQFKQLNTKLDKILLILDSLEMAEDDEAFEDEEDTEEEVKEVPKEKKLNKKK